MKKNNISRYALEKKLICIYEKRYGTSSKVSDSEAYRSKAQRLIKALSLRFLGSDTYYKNEENKYCYPFSFVKLAEFMAEKLSEPDKEKETYKKFHHILLNIKKGALSFDDMASFFEEFYDYLESQNCQDILINKLIDTIWSVQTAILYVSRWNIENKNTYDIVDIKKKLFFYCFCKNKKKVRFDTMSLSDLQNFRPPK